MAKTENQKNASTLRKISEQLDEMLGYAGMETVDTTQGCDFWNDVAQELNDLAEKLENNEISSGGDIKLGSNTYKVA